MAALVFGVTAGGVLGNSLRENIFQLGQPGKEFG